MGQNFSCVLDLLKMSSNSYWKTLRLKSCCWNILFFLFKKYQVNSLSEKSSAAPLWEEPPNLCRGRFTHLADRVSASRFQTNSGHVCSPLTALQLCSLCVCETDVASVCPGFLRGQTVTFELPGAVTSWVMTCSGPSLHRWSSPARLKTLHLRFSDYRTQNLYKCIDRCHNMALIDSLQHWRTVRRLCDV